MTTDDSRVTRHPPQSKAHAKELLRQRLLSDRKARPIYEQEQMSQRICFSLINFLQSYIQEHRVRVISAFWPIRGEPDVRSLVGAAQLAEVEWALPEVNQKGQPLTFVHWEPEAKMGVDVYGIPTPILKKIVQPEILLVPCLGFNRDCFRLGYGVGYYDRTLSEQKIITIGVAYSQDLQTWQPETFDQALDYVITEEQLWSAPNR